ncbi:Mitochondrial inner membrane protease atp23 [Coemansia biformis]|uniref:Mitochondrial inner membrane protease ATP23 n=1 Tax=Coemansia biformis TaxID=1286918 RepID=A0A9W8CWT8_9FUNG|nr:Mitochondrial inner membrane protease atp23 [Coemansia biformis]
MASPGSRRDESRQQYKAMAASERGAFDSWTRALKDFTGLGLTPEEQTARRLRKNFEYDLAACRLCEKWRDELLATSPPVRFMAEHLKSSGMAVTGEDMPCMRCNEMRTGGFAPPNQIQLCYNQLFSKGLLGTTMVHEMIHAYDHANFRIDWSNLEHHACTEIRAASLSGDCSWFQEFLRGNLGFLKHHQICVKRRAALSVRANPKCKSAKHAEAAVNKVFQSCFTDTRPFDEIY